VAAALWVIEPGASPLPAMVSLAALALASGLPAAMLPASVASTREGKSAVVPLPAVARAAGLIQSEAVQAKTSTSIAVLMRNTFLPKCHLRAFGLALLS